MIHTKTQNHPGFLTIPLRWWVAIILVEGILGILVGIIPALQKPGLFFAGLFLLIYFTIALIRPQVALGILVFGFPFYNFTFYIIYQNHTYKLLLLFPTVFGILLAVALLTRIGAKLHTYQPSQVFILVPLFLLIFWSIFSSGWAQNHFFSWYAGLNLLVSFAVMYSILQLIQTEHQLTQMLWSVFFAGLITATAIILSTLLTKDWVFNYDLYQNSNFKLILNVFFYLMPEKTARAMGFGTYNQMALLMSLHLFITGVLFVYTKRWATRIFLGGAMAYMLYAHMLTKTRAPMVGMLLGAFLAVYLLSRRIQAWRQKPIWLMTVVVFICFALLLVSILGNFEKGLMRYTSTVSGIEVKDSSWTLRLTWLKEGIYYFIITYGLGVGAGNISYFLYNNAPHPHDTYLHLVTELGIIGAIILAVMLSSIIKNTGIALRRKNLSVELTRTIAIIAGALFAFGFALGFEHDYYWIATWIYLAILLTPINLALSIKMKNEELGMKNENFKFLILNS
jgi:teichuronic acid biosynthesis protein TuaE